MKPARAMNTGAGEKAAATGCKLFEARRQIPPFPCALNGAEMTESGLFPARALYLKTALQD